jgi:hypothetical protein
MPHVHRRTRSVNRQREVSAGMRKDDTSRDPAV